MIKIKAEAQTKIKENLFKGQIQFNLKSRTLKVKNKGQDILQIFQPFEGRIINSFDNVLLINEDKLLITVSEKPVHLKVFKNRKVKGLILKDGQVFEGPSEYFIYSQIVKTPVEEASLTVPDTPPTESTGMFKKIKGQIYTIWLPENIKIDRGIQGYPVKQKREITFIKSPEFVSIIMHIEGLESIEDRESILDKHFLITTFETNKKGHKQLTVNKQKMLLAFDGKKIYLI